MGVVTGIVAGITAVAGYKSYKQQKRAANAAEESNRMAARAEALRAQRERISALRSQRIRTATAINYAATSGTAGSSMIEGGLAAFNTETAGNIGFVNNMNTLTAAQMAYQAQSQKFSNQASMWSTIASLPSATLNAYSSAKALR